jgi:O-antigen/teichoic acid export membrane protein
LARFLKVNDFGIYVFTLSFIYNFIPVADFGIERLVLKDISSQPNKATEYISKLLPLRIFFSLGSYFLAILLGIILGQSLEQIIFLSVFGLILLPYNLVYFLCSFLNAKEKMIYTGIANISLVSLTAVIGVLAVLMQFELLIVFFAYPLASLIVSIFFLVNSKNSGLSIGWKIDISFWKEKLSQSWVFAVFSIVSVFYLRISLIFVKLFHGSEAVGLYGASFKFLEAMILIPQSIALAFFPLSSRLFLNDKENLKKIYKKGLIFQFCFSLFLVFPLIFYPEFIINLAYGREYLSAAFVFPILGLALIFFFVNSLAGNIIHNSPRVRNFLPQLISNMIVKIILCLIFIPRWSITGAAWAVVGAEAYGFLINNYFVWRVLK